MIKYFGKLSVRNLGKYIKGVSGKRQLSTKLICKQVETQDLLRK